MLIAMTLLYLAALCLFAVGTWGLFGNEEDPLAGVFLVPLGLPWNMLVDPPDGPARPALALLAPAVNIALMLVICRPFRERR